jgi:glycosyltransferase involved in cell wall biosynthesis
MSLGITMVITSCGRQDLLAETLRSFEQFATNTLDELIIVEDGPDDNSFVRDIIPSAKKITLLNSPVPRRGQLINIEWAYSKVTTPYIFHCEDDWRFTKPRFIEDSRRILEAEPNCLMVHLRSHQDQWQQDFNRSWIDDPTYTVNDDEGELTYWKTRPWIQHDGGFGFTFNPGLRRLADYKKINGLATPIAQRYGPIFNVKDGCLVERTNAENYQRMGMWCASLEPEGRVEHIGWHRHIPT